ncbi:polysaccharide deacetylase family protein [Zavarzinia sp. CC-PAN008]|uniref:polysaccharide deacetylase family protein n=1 Tax=Zavarzinia sp. CC-PAN008 TaxID=3243332 RepID=UPI003F7481FD
MFPTSVPWPNGARCAVAFTYDMDADSILHLAHHATAHSRVASLSMLRYGPQVGMPRILKVLKEAGIRQTFFVPGWSIERYPEAVEAMLKDGHEVAHHGYLHELPSEMNAEQEAYWFQRATDVIVKYTGQKPRGYRAPSYRFSDRTLDLMIAGGMTYDASLMGDDVPYVLESEAGSLVALATHATLDDWPHFMYGRDFNYVMQVRSVTAAFEVYRDEFDAAWEEGGMWIAVWHPFLSGRPSRAQATARLIRHMQDKGGVWFATMEEIAAHVRSLQAAGTWSPRVDRMPYYTGPIPELFEGPGVTAAGART